jgi:hypothetical protein
MKHIRTTFVALLLTIAATSFAQWTKNGYYRVLNEATERYITIIDNKAKVSTMSTYIDLGALVTVSGFDRVVSNPASIIYIRYEKSPSLFSLASQGTDTREITGEYLTIQPSTTNRNAYWACGKKGGSLVYLNDVYSLYDTSEVGTNGSGKTRNWYILPVNKDIDKQYFGIKPEIEYNGKYYATIYAYFPFKLNEGMKAYSITLNTNSVAVYKEITGTIPRSTPVLIECSSPTPDGNRIDIVDETTTSISGNKLEGVWFCSHKDGHINRKAYSSSTMRVLGLTQDGKLGFITAPDSYLSYDGGKYYLPANKAYLPVTSNSQSELYIMSEEDYLAGVSTISIDDVKQSAVYTLTGLQVRKRDESTEGLSKGIYVVKGKKIIVH